MECEEFCYYQVDPRCYIDKCSMEPTFSFPNTIQDVICSNNVDLERLLQMETNLMDFDFIDQDGIMGLDKGEYAIFGNETEQKV